MKKLIVASIVLLVAVAGCGNRLTAWGLTSPETDVTLRVGAESVTGDIGSTEVGVVAKYPVGDKVTNDFKPYKAGGYVIFHLTQEVGISDTDAPSPIKPFLESLNAQPYAGAEFITDVDGEGRKVQTNWILGTKFLLDPVSDFCIVVEYIDGDDTPPEVAIGGRGRFFQF